MKKRSHFSVYALILVLLTVTAAVLAACGEEPAAPAGPLPGEETSAPAEEAAEEWSADDPLAFLEDRDYGYTFRVLTIAADLNGTERFSDEIFYETESGETMHNAVYHRNQLVEDKLGVTVQAIPSHDALSDARNSAMAGSDDYDLLSVYKGDLAALAGEGLLRDWNELADLDLDRPWWNQAVRDRLSLFGATYYVSGSILTSDIDDTVAMVFNKELAAKNNVGDLYGAVRDGKWTLDTMMATVKGMSADLDGDDRKMPGKDQFGYVQDSGSMAANWAFCCDLMNGSIDEETNTYDFNVDVGRAQTLLEKMAAMFNADYALTDVELYTGLSYFESNQIFLYAVILYNIDSLRSMDVDFGILPYPKFDEAQENYITQVGGASPFLGMLNTNRANDERMSEIMQALGAASHATVLPAYYDKVLIGKGIRDNESEEMLNIILASRTYDLSFMISGGVAIPVLEQILSHRAAFASYWAKREPTVSASMQDYIETVLFNNG